MKRMFGALCRAIVVGGAFAFLSFIGCAPREMAGAGRAAPATGPRAAEQKPAAIQSDTAAARRPWYDLEEEMPERAPQRPAELIERLEPMTSDTIAVQDIATDETPRQRYDIGYRIQVFASSDRGAAQKVRDAVIAQTRLATYIDYEDGLYKVRAGDFTERKDAAQARVKLAGAYPGSWIVRTTILK